MSSFLKKIFLFYIFLLPFSYFCFLKHSYFLNFSDFKNQIIGYFIGALPLIFLILFSLKNFSLKEFNNNLFKAIILGIFTGGLIAFLGFLLFQKKLGFFKDQLFFGIVYWLFLAFSQEIFFRGCFLKELLKNFSLKKSLFINSLMFALWHMIIPFSRMWLDPLNFIFVFLVSLIWGIIYLKTENPLSSIISHFLVGVFLSQF